MRGLTLFAFLALILLLSQVDGNPTKRDDDDDDDDDAEEVDSEEYDYDSNEEDYEELPEPVLIAYCQNDYRENMETNNALTNHLPKITVTGQPSQGAEDVRINRQGWQPVVPAPGSPQPFIVLELPKDQDEPAPYVSQIIAASNAYTTIEIQEYGSTVYKTARELGGTRFESVINFNKQNPIKPQKIKITLGETRVPSVAKYSLKVAVYACYPDRAGETQDASDESD